MVTTTGGTILIPQDKWFRLERYARWQSKRFSLAKLPNDILENIIHRLGRIDLENFLNAILHFEPNLSCRSDALAVPPQIRRHWISQVVLHSFTSHLWRLADTALFHCRETSGAIFVANWTTFSPSADFKPLGQYSWQRFPEISAEVDIFESTVRDTINSCYEKQMCAVRLSLHTYIIVHGQVVVNPFAAYWQVYCVFPHYVFE